MSVKWHYRLVNEQKRTDVAIVPAPITVDYSFVVQADTTQLQFTALFTGPVTTFDWDFGDGSINSSLPNPFHAFDVPPGTSVEFDVRLTVDGGVFEEKSIIVSAPATGPVDLDVLTLTPDEVLNMTPTQALNMVPE